MRWRFALVGLFVFGCVDRASGPPPVVVQVPVQPVAAATTSGAPIAGGPAARQNTGREVGDRVDVEWQGSWYPAAIRERQGDRFLVHYDGYGDDWDEVVPPSRVRDRRVDEPNEPEDVPDW